MNKDRIEKVLDETKDVNLVVASKYLDSKGIIELYKLGIHNFGENRVDAFLEKYDALKDYDIVWHFIGHLQKNKAKKIINKITYLHSLDSLELAKIINDKCDKKLKCFVEVHLTSSETKNGVKEDDLDIFMEEVKKYQKVDIIGFMTMTDENQTIDEKREVFHELNLLAKKYNLKELSMGMSLDYKIAIEEGATFVRLGHIICD